MLQGARLPLRQSSLLRTASCGRPKLAPMQSRSCRQTRSAGNRAPRVVVVAAPAGASLRRRPLLNRFASRLCQSWRPLAEKSCAGQYLAATAAAAVRAKRAESRRRRACRWPIKRPPLPPQSPRVWPNGPTHSAPLQRLICKLKLTCLAAALQLDGAAKYVARVLFDAARPSAQIRRRPASCASQSRPNLESANERERWRELIAAFQGAGLGGHAPAPSAQACRGCVNQFMIVSPS